jgi:hypothetical protein
LKGLSKKVAIITDAQTSLTRTRLRTPRAAAIAGNLFALLYGAILVLIRSSIPADPAAGSVWLDSNSRIITLALNLCHTPGLHSCGSSV